MNIITEAMIDSCLAKMVVDETDWIWEYDADSKTDNLMAFSALAELSGASQLANELKKKLAEEDDQPTITTSPDETNDWWIKAERNDEPIE